VKLLPTFKQCPWSPFRYEWFESNGLEVKTVYLPPNTTSLLQPMDQGAVSTFKAHSLWDLLRLFEWPMTSRWESTGSHRTSWKESPIFQRHGVKRQNHVSMTAGLSFGQTAFRIHRSTTRHRMWQIALADAEGGNMNELPERYSEELPMEDFTLHNFQYVHLKK
jgi:hypothetical protein